MTRTNPPTQTPAWSRSILGPRSGRTARSKSQLRRDRLARGEIGAVGPVEALFLPAPAPVVTIDLEDVPFSAVTSTTRILAVEWA